MDELYCFECGKSFNEENDIGIPIATVDEKIGRTGEGVICLECAARINKETGGTFLGVKNISDLDFSHYLNGETWISPLEKKKKKEKIIN